MGVRRGVMAEDHFTQIANALFRDSRISFKAKGLFGLISTHRDGWRVSVGDLAHSGREGRDAVSAGLRELERFGYLARERMRRADGTLGEVVYSITDVPNAETDGFGGDSAIVQLHHSRSQPESENPALGKPGLADRSIKNTSLKKTITENGQLVIPSVRDERARDTSRGLGDRVPAPSRNPALESSCRTNATTPGTELLLSIGAVHPELRLTGQALHDQGLVIDGLLDAGWTASQVQHVVASRPLPKPVRRTVGAVIAARLRAASETAPPTDSASSFMDARVRGTSASRPVPDAVAYRALVECTGCGSPGRAAGLELCPACLGWPACSSCTGPTPRRASPAGDGRCTVCAAEASQAS